MLTEGYLSLPLFTHQYIAVKFASFYVELLHVLPLFDREGGECEDAAGHDVRSVLEAGDDD
jgi:hypothetical protein